MIRPATMGLLLLATAIAAGVSASAATNEAITTAAEILSLAPEQAAQKIPLSVTGVVTLCEQTWGGRFFVQDSTAGVFVNNTRSPRPVPGDLVHVSGVTHAGGYAPDIVSPKWEKLGTSPLPEARLISGERLLSGAEDGQRVEVLGIVRSVRSLSTKAITMEVAAGDCHFHAFTPIAPDLDLNSLVGASVRLRGTAAASFNQSLGHIVTVSLYLPRAEDFIVDQVPGPGILQAPFTPLGQLARYRRQGSDPRIRVRGIVTFQRPGEDIFLQDKGAGLQVMCRDTNVIALGEVVEAIGFPVTERFLPVLQNATITRTGMIQPPAVDSTATLPGILGGRHHAELIALEAKLLDRSLRALRSSRSSSNSPAEYVLTLQRSNYLVSATAPVNAQFAGLAAVPIGSTLIVSGICFLQTGANGAVESVQLLLPNAASVVILQRPSWWTAQHLLIGLGTLLAGSLVGITWTVMIFRKNSALRSSIAEKIKAQIELQKAHDELESRVAERSKELKVEMSARQEAEVQYNAIAAERTRLAQELHDTLLQGFTGIGLKLEAFTSSLPASLAAEKARLQKLLEQSDEYLVEARRAVWELRSPSLDQQGGLSGALQKVSKRAVQGTRIQLLFTNEGTARKLTEAIEDNLLRICEEAVTNAVKHARPTQVEVNLEYMPEELRLRIRDDGCGFDQQGLDHIKNGHLGLVGIRERTKTLGGKLSLRSQPGMGTEVLVSVPQGE